MTPLLTLAIWALVPALLLWALVAGRARSRELKRRPVAQASARGVRDRGFGFWPRIDTQQRAEDAARIAPLPLAAPMAIALCLLLGLAFLVGATAAIAPSLAWFDQRQAAALLEGLWALAPSLEDGADWGATLAATIAVVLAALRVRAGKLATAPIWAGLSACLAAGHFWLLAAIAGNGGADMQTVAATLLYAAPGLLIMATAISSLRGWLWLVRNKVPMQA